AVTPPFPPGSPYYDNVRPLCYSDSDAVLLCFDISRPETLDSAAKKWKTEILDYCPNTRVLLIGCKTDLRTDLSTLLELSHQKQAPISYEQGWGAASSPCFFLASLCSLPGSFIVSRRLFGVPLWLSWVSTVPECPPWVSLPALPCSLLGSLCTP
ncbi:PREDICTED: rho-related GTP-binding protein Rho6, partial [Corvus brachyrhynchos]|uniref:rho-related GTP-binding protein Rho6 n=1 Tax=Corvus brachyrhynchos TaxID=85066 RepID=UPI000816761A